MTQPYHFCIYSLKNHLDYSRNNYISMFTTAVFTVNKLWKQPKYPVNAQINEQNIVYIHSRVLLNH
jgi:hypothetical protein